MFLLDRRTGRSVHTITNAAEALEDHSGSLGETNVVALGSWALAAALLSVGGVTSTWLHRLTTAPQEGRYKSLYDKLRQAVQSLLHNPCTAGQAMAMDKWCNMCVSCAGLTMGVPLDQTLALGRQDYIVRSVRMDTKAETWNATFSKLYLIPSGAPGSIKDFLHEGRAATSAQAGAGS